MNRKTLAATVCLLTLLHLAVVVAGQTATPADEKKHTIPGDYVNAAAAYAMWKAAPEVVKILDCRTPEEYVFVGHAPMAYNVPSMLWTGRWDDQKHYIMEENPDFAAQVKKIFAADDRILVMCRSGHRSAASVNKLAAAGFKNVYNIVDGFEGDVIKDEESYHQGKRMKNGWKNSNAPWTYTLESKLVFKPVK
jgi:rhodanese-related sulfurtransferase